MKTRRSFLASMLAGLVAPALARAAKAAPAEPALVRVVEAWSSGQSIVEPVACLRRNPGPGDFRVLGPSFVAWNPAGWTPAFVRHGAGMVWALGPGPGGIPILRAGN